MKDKKKKIILLSFFVIVVAIIAIYFLIKYQTYNYVELTTVYENNNTDNSNYIQCLDGVLRYSRDGVVLLTEKGDEIWNQPCQMNNPMVEMCGDSVAIGDKGGTNILVFQKNGLKGEIHTTKTIEKFAVSSQGIVSTILKDDNMPLVICYDAVGNKLVEHKIIPKNTGYPVDVALSEDGNTLIVSYIYTEGTEVTTKVSYYYFGDRKETKDYQVYQKDFSNTVIPVATFMRHDISLLVADNKLIFNKGLNEIKEMCRVELKTEIQSIAYNDEFVAVLLRKDNATDYQLNMYNSKGKLLSTVNVEKEYESLKIAEEQIVLYDGQACAIYMKNGVKKYEGNIDQKIMEIFTRAGLNKYMVINASGFYEVRLAK